MIGFLARKVNPGRGGLDPIVAVQLAIGDFRQHATVSAKCLIDAVHVLQLDETGNVSEAQLDEIEGQMLRTSFAFARLRTKVREYRRSRPLPFHAQKGSAS